MAAPKKVNRASNGHCGTLRLISTYNGAAQVTCLPQAGLPSLGGARDSFWRFAAHYAFRYFSNPMNQRLVLDNLSKKSFVTLASQSDLVQSVQDFLDMSGWAGEHNTNLILLAETNLPRDFYDLSTRVAGDMLQKVSNYHLRLAVFGAYNGVSDRFREFMLESNKGRQVRFARTYDEAVLWLLS